VKVGYNQTVSGAMVLLGAAGAVLVLLFGNYPLVVPSVVFFLYGVLMLTRTYFEYEPDSSTILIKAPLGPLVNRYQGNLRFTDGRLRCTRDDGRTRTVPVRRVLSNPEHWRAFRAELKKSNAVT
jgi:hypothetical protein